MPVGMHEWSTSLPSATCLEACRQRTLFLGSDMHTSVEAWGRDSTRMPVGMHVWSTSLPSATCPEARRQCKSRRQTIPNTRRSIPSPNRNDHPLQFMVWYVWARAIDLERSNGSSLCYEEPARGPEQFLAHSKSILTIVSKLECWMSGIFDPKAGEHLTTLIVLTCWSLLFVFGLS